MKFGGLSEKEIQKLTELLDAEGISFDVSTDQDMIDNHNQSMKYNLRHLNAPSISNHILSLVINDESFSKMSPELIEQLLSFGITNKIPSDLEFSEEAPELIQKELLKGNERLVGSSFLHQLLIAGGAFIIYCIFKSF